MRRWGLLGAALFALVLAGCSGVIHALEARPTPPSAETARSFYPDATDGADLLVIGDWGSGTADEERVAAGMEAYAADHQIDAILTTGDNLYNDDPIEALAPYRWAKDAGIDFWVSWGNHDVESRQRIDDVNESFSTPPLWATIEWGEVAILILDSTDAGAPDQLEYLESEMARIDEPTIVVFHYPPFSCSSHHDNEYVTEEFLPRFDDDVVLVLNGHAHTYQRFVDDGVQYVVTGGGGRGLHDIEDCPSGHVPRVVGLEEFHYLTLTQEGHRLELSAIDSTGRVIDDLSIPLTATQDG